jgi:hypothetical protein
MIVQHSGILAMALVFMVSSCCCCGNLFDISQLQGLLGGDVEQILEEQLGNIEDILEPTATPADTGSEAAEDAANEAAESAAEAIEEIDPEAITEDLDLSEMPDLSDLPDDLEQELEGLLSEIEEQIGEGDIPDINFECGDVSFPIPDDATECISVAGFTSISTNLGEAEVDELYDDYFTGQGWEQFPMMMQGDEVLNAWQSPDEQEYALLNFLPGEGVDGANLVGLALIGNP